MDQRWKNLKDRVFHQQHERRPEGYRFDLGRGVGRARRRQLRLIKGQLSIEPDAPMKVEMTVQRMGNTRGARVTKTRPSVSG